MAMQLRLVDGHQLAVNQSLMASGTKVSFENVDVSREWLQAANTDDRKRKAFVTLVAARGQVAVDRHTARACAA